MTKTESAPKVNAFVQFAKRAREKDTEAQPAEDPEALRESARRLKDTRPFTEVAVGVLIRRDGAVLLGSRPEGKPYAGYWEFPGGKIEPGESAAEALAREMKEELDLELSESYPWFVREISYPHARVRLHFRRCWRWRGTPRAMEGQEYGFFSWSSLKKDRVLPMVQEILALTRLPERAALVMGPAMEGVQESLIDQALAGGAKLLNFGTWGPDDAYEVPAIPGVWTGSSYSRRSFRNTDPAEPSFRGALYRLPFEGEGHGPHDFVMHDGVHGEYLLDEPARLRALVAYLERAEIPVYLEEGWFKRLEDAVRAGTLPPPEGLASLEASDTERIRAWGLQGIWTDAWRKCKSLGWSA